ncbi:MAG: hypothetical protein RLO81_14465 [Fulvivirga sp.]|uniref:hypothetical protein n=1 Tax=Fulvivirga sp. TaxID=1931237 RepID=UPI0032F0644F
MKYIISGLLLIFSTAASFCQYNNFKNVSLEMETETAKGGYVSNVLAKIVYGNDGSMVSFYKSPKEYIVFNNAKGEIKIYDPQKNTVLQQQNYFYSTETSQFYFFLNNKKSDLGLNQMGFTQSNVKFEEGLMITEWLPPTQMATQVSKVELVHENGDPIYIAYFDNENNVSTKSFYYNYVDLAPRLNFPSSITQINYTTPTDSTITRTTYSNIKLDRPENLESLNFKIPNDAKNIN